jgi:site-specific DNA-cytosine methylase
MNKKDIVVISLFDGLSGARLALEEVEHLNVLRYYSSEIDKYAIQVADNNFQQDTEYRLGSVIDIDTENLLTEIHKDFGEGVELLLVGGSPCQGFSMAGKLKGSSTKEGVDVTSLEQYLQLKEEGFEFDGQSYLFWEYIRIKEDLQPKYWLLENVRVTKKWLPMFNKAVDVEPVFINSKLLSAQSRPRFYWSNIVIPQPKDINILLKDILINLPIDKPLTPFMSDEFDGVSRLDKGMCQTVGSGHGNKYLISRPCEMLPRKKNSTHVADATDIRGNESIKRVYSEEGKSPTVTTQQGGHREVKVLISECRYRKLTPLECERLQTLPDNTTQILKPNGKPLISDTQRFKMVGNGFTRDVIVHIFKGIK